LKLRIYDRYGRTVFESSNAEYIQNTGWDGTDGGNKLPSDNYFFAISGKLENGQDIKIDGKNNGSIFLNR
jgi:gliding motility-associated-like protein